MPFTIPNLADAAFSAQASPFSTDIAILQAGVDGDGVVSGCAVTAQGSPDMTLAVAVGRIRIAAVDATVTAGNVTITTANGTNPRIDLVVVNNSGTKSVTAGTAAAAPVPPAVPANSIVLAMVYVPAGDTAINTNQITDKRCDLGALTCLSTNFAGIGDYPAANHKGQLLLLTDISLGTLYRSDGTTWLQVAPPLQPAAGFAYSVLPTSALAETLGRPQVDSATIAAGVSGQLRMVGIWLQVSTTVTNITFLSGSTALATGTHSWFALYNSSRVLLRQSNDDTTFTWAANTALTYPLSSPFVTIYTGLYYLGVLLTASTMPTLSGGNSTVATNTIVPILGGTSTGSLTATAPDPAAAITPTAGVPYAYVH